MQLEEVGGSRAERFVVVRQTDSFHDLRPFKKNLQGKVVVFKEFFLAELKGDNIESLSRDLSGNCRNFAH